MGSEFIKRKSSVSASKSDAKPSLFAKRPSSVQRRNKRTPNTQLKNNPLTLDSLFAKLGSNIHPEEIQQKCDDCESESVQTKLTIGEPGDKYEQEADATAAQVMAMSDESVQRQNSQQTEETLVQQNPNPITQEDKKPQNGLDFVFTKLGSNIHPGKIQSKATDKNQVNPSLENRLSTSKGGGNPLPDNVRTFMEPRFGADFSEVRTHTDSGAVQMNKELGAQAFAHGNDIYYGAGKSPGNDELTAHELTHTIQQGGGKQLQGKYEQQEDVVARKESAGEYAGNTFEKNTLENEPTLLKEGANLYAMDNSVRPPEGDPDRRCFDLLAEIERLANELQKRYNEMLADKNWLYQAQEAKNEHRLPKELGTWGGHQYQYEKKQEKLEQVLKDFQDDKNCDDDNDPDGYGAGEGYRLAEEYADKPAPEQPNPKKPGDEAPDWARSWVEELGGTIKDGAIVVGQGATQATIAILSFIASILLMPLRQNAY